MTTAALGARRPAPRVLVGSAVLLALAVGLALLVGAQERVHTTLAWAGVTAVLVCALAHVALPLGGNSYRYLAVGLSWGAGTALAGAFPDAHLGPLPLPQVLLTAGTAGPLLVLGGLVRRSRADSDDPPLIVDAAMLGSALTVTGWDALVRSGAHPAALADVAVTVGGLTAASTVVGAAVVLAVEHARLRPAGIAFALFGAGTSAACIAYHVDPLVSRVGIVTALATGAAGLVLLPRDGVVSHSGQAAARAARRLETASLVPGPVLLADLVLLVVSPRVDPVLYALYTFVLVAFTVRHVATSRAIDRTTTKLRSQALHDDLTGLPNRTALADALTGPDHQRSVVLLEIVGLDDVNDVLGVPVGDSLVRAAALDVQRAAHHHGGTTHRTGGDELAVLLPGDARRALHVAHELVAAVADAPARVPGTSRFPLTAVAGTADCPDPGTDADADADAMAPFVHADIALRDARRRGPGTVSVYSGDVAAAHARRSQLRERLTHAVRTDGVDVHFQPIVSFTTGRVEKFEALARWEDAVLGRISPVEFISVAEESNLVVALGEQVLRRAVRTAAAHGVFAAGVGLAVNVSVVQLQAPGFSDVVRDVLAAHAVPPHLLTLELTESVFLDTDSPAERVVTELAGLGCRIAIDDFGTGYSAFGYLGRLPVHTLKIDRSLTRALTTDVNGQSVVTCVVDLATRLGLTVVVEGVETAAQAQVCRFINAPLGQGWLYSAAVPADQLAAQLASSYPVPEKVTR